MITTRLKRSVSTLIATGVSILATGAIHAATIQNFEGALSGNESLQGDAGIWNSGYFGINDASGGNGQLLLTTINTSTANTPDSVAGYTSQFVGKNAVAPGSFFDGFAPNDVGTTGKEGSGYKLINLSLTAGQVLSFDYDFLTQEPAGVGGGGNKDFAFYTLSIAHPATSNTAFADTFTSLLMGTTGVNNPFGSETGYNTVNIPITTTGTYTLTIGVMDAGNISTDDSPSALLVDNIQTNAAVPEPSTLGLLFAGAAGFAAVRRRIRK
jgi:hypothetical protein